MVLKGFGAPGRDPGVRGSGNTALLGVQGVVVLLLLLDGTGQDRTGQDRTGQLAFKLQVSFLVGLDVCFNVVLTCAFQNHF